MNLEQVELKLQEIHKLMDGYRVDTPSAVDFIGFAKETRDTVEEHLRAYSLIITDFFLCGLKNDEILIDLFGTYKQVYSEILRKYPLEVFVGCWSLRNKEFVLPEKLKAYGVSIEGKR